MYRLGDVLRIDRALEQRALAVEFLKLLLLDPVRLGALLAPFALPDLGAAQYGIGIDHIDANAKRRPFERQATGEMDLRRLGGAVGGGTGRGGNPILRADEH